MPELSDEERRKLSPEAQAALERMLADEARHDPSAPGRPITNPDKFGGAIGFDDQGNPFPGHDDE